jgi:hypothetical protein
MARKLPEQHAFSYATEGIPPRRSATAEELAARRQRAAYDPHSFRSGQPQERTMRTGDDQRDPRSVQRTTYRESHYPPANPSRAGHHAGLHPEDAPYSSEEFASSRGRQQVQLPVDIREEDLPDDAPRPPTSAVRYPDTHGQPRYTRDIYGQAKPTRLLRSLSIVKPLVVSLVIVSVMIIGWIALTQLGTWWTNQQNQWAFGYPRLFQTDAVVGHGDSPSHPSHFIAINLDRQIIVIEIPGGNAAKAKIYIGPTLIGDGQELIPVTVTFEEGAKPGKPDMYIHIGDQVIVFLNDGTKFVAPSPPH